MVRHSRKEGGFTLVEAIASMVLAGIVVTVAGMALVTGAKGYALTKSNVQIAQKSQVAMGRMSRELKELLTVTSAQAARMTFTRLDQNNAAATLTFYLDTASKTLRLVQGAQATGGDILLDNVQSLAFTYLKGASAWTDTEDVQLLSTVRVNYTLTREDGTGAFTFSTSITPRNNKNAGGVPPPVDRPNDLGYCFVDAAREEAPAPERQPLPSGLPVVAVMLLLAVIRRRRDAQGRAAVKNPALLRSLFGKPARPGAAARGTCPFRARVYPAIQSKPLREPENRHAWNLWQGPGARRRLQSARNSDNRHKRPGRGKRDEGGSVLVAIIATMVLVAMLGAAMLPITNTGSQGQLGAQGTMQAYYLAESGYRYAASRYLNTVSEASKDQTLYDLHYQHSGLYTLSGSGGSFDLDIYPHFARTTGAGGASTLSAQLPGALSTGLTLGTGFAEINGTIHQYSAVNTSGAPSLVFTISSGSWPASIGTGQALYFASRPSSTQTVSNNSRTLTLEATTGSAQTFPALNGSFRVRGQGGSDTNYIYERRSGATLYGITPLNDPDAAFSFTVNTTNGIVLDKFVELHSTGLWGAGTPVETSRRVIYFAPIGFVSGGIPNQKVTYLDTFDDTTLQHWFTGGDDEGQVGTHAVVDVDGNKALDVTSRVAPDSWLGGVLTESEWSVLHFSWSGTNANLAAAWEAAGQLLSYDIQTKIRVTDPTGAQDPYYMAGMLFRTQPYGEDDSSSYGISLLRARQERGWLVFWGPWYGDDEIPEEFEPSAIWEGTLETVDHGIWQERFSQPAIVLWQRTGGNFRWIAYRILTNADIVVNNGRVKNWSTLAARIIECYPMSFSNGGGGGFRYGDEVVGATSGATAEVNGTPVLSSGDWTGGTAAGALPLANVRGTFQASENLLVGGTVRARATSTPGGRTNHIRAYYGDTDAHTPNAVPTDNNRGANPRVTGSGTVNWPMDNIGDWAAANDYLTLVQWTGYNSSYATRLGTGVEANAIIQSSALSSPQDGGDTFTASELALHSTGKTADHVYFDDFAVQVEGATPSSTGFLPPIQK
jgi:hypothetical protein